MSLGSAFRFNPSNSLICSPLSSIPILIPSQSQSQSQSQSLCHLTIFSGRKNLGLRAQNLHLKIVASMESEKEFQELNRNLYPDIEPYSSGFLKVSGIHTIYWEQSGNPNGHPVVFLHGGPGGGTSPSNRKFFDPDFYRIILFDQRGAGKSTPHACLEENTTWDLVEDIEKLRKHLEIPEWQVFGGSWGSTLALAYSQSHPDKVTGIILRGIFLMRKKELDWFYEGGAAAIYPDAWESFRDLIPENERESFIDAYWKRLNSVDLETQYAAARVWTKWELTTAHLLPNEDNIKKGDDDKFSLAFARIENHYFVNKGFFASDSFLLDNVEKIRHINTVIVQGRYDMCCPMMSAWDLHKAWPEAELKEMSSGTGSLGSTSGTPMEEDDHAPLWCYVTKLEKMGGGGNTRFKCNYCQQEYRGSYFRVKAHLLKLSGNGIRVCPKVTSQHLAEMQRKIEEAEKRLKMAMPKKVPLPLSTQSTSTSSGALDIGGFRMEGYEPRKRKATGTSALEKAFNPVIREQLHSEIARMFYSAGLPFHLSRNPYYVSAFQFAANNPIPGYVPPGYNLLRTTLLQKERANVERLLEPTRASWKEKGLSIVSDGWTDSQRKPLINFMGASEAGAVFLKAVNCEGEHKDKFFISNLISQAIEEVGHQNVIQVITDNAPVCSAAGLLIESKYPNIFWTPCVVHTLNLALKNICAPKETGDTAFAYDECHWITLCVDDVMFIKNFIMNHSMRLAIFNEFVPLKLLAVADTRFASAIIMLKRFKLIKRGLQSMVISDQWVSYKGDDVGKAASVKEKLLNDVWWDKIDYILTFTLPIYEMLRFCDTDKPCLHLVYEMWDTMIEKVKASIFRHEGKLDHEESIFYSVVHNILVERWSKSNTPLHCLAHSLNPRYYSSTWLDENPNRVPPYRDEEISSMRNKCFKKYFPNLEERRVVNREYAKFSGGLDMFGDLDSKIDRGVLDPLIWWFTHGSPAPMLQSLALKLLGQPCSSSCCERNWSTYSFIHSMKRNKMTPQRAEDLVFVHNNLRLLSRRSQQYIEGESKLWDVGGDAFDSLEGAGLLEIASLSLDEPDMEAVIFTDEGEQVEPIDVEDS